MNNQTYTYTISGKDSHGWERHTAGYGDDGITCHCKKSDDGLLQVSVRWTLNDEGEALAKCTLHGAGLAKVSWHESIAAACLHADEAIAIHDALPRRGSGNNGKTRLMEAHKEAMGSLA